MESRLTFREKQPDICWQKQLRDHYADEGVPPVPHLNLKKAIVRPVSYSMAKQIIFKYEWLGTMGTIISDCYGIFFGLYCAGVTTFSPAGFNLPALAKTFKIKGNQLRYLSRGANVHWAPKGANSKLISWSLKHEARHGKLAIAFSDSDAGEIGTVYQATNWVYIGKGSTWKQWVSADGKIWSFNQFTNHVKMQNTTGVKLKADLIKKGWREQETNPKGRYVYILDRTDKRLIDKVESMRQPYPKRDKQAIGSDQEHSEGAAPIVTLQKVVNQ